MDVANVCVECRAVAVADDAPIQCGDIFSLTQPTAIYIWSAAEGRALGHYAQGTRLIVIDRVPPLWWKVAVQPNRFRTVIDDDAVEPTLLYPNLSAPDLSRVGALCQRHLGDLVRYFRPRGDARTMI